jgi:hypothetical protein
MFFGGSLNYPRAQIIGEFRLPSGLEWPFYSNYLFVSNHKYVQITIQWRNLNYQLLEEFEFPFGWEI